jgi:hypothetical protein
MTEESSLRHAASDALADSSALPDDLSTCHEMIGELLGALREEKSLVAHLQRQLEQMLRHRYGRRSEAIDWENGLFPREVLEALFAEVAEKEDKPAEKETV